MATAPTVLFVDDNVAGRHALGRFLSLAGINVRETGTGGEALRIAREDPPDLILLDVDLPDIDGTEVCRRLRLHPQTARIPIVQVSATSKSPEDQVRGLECGADAYLLEPLDPAVLVATVRALLRARNAEQELATVRDELAGRIDDLTRLHELINRLAGSVDMNAVLDEILSAVTDLQGTDMSALMLLDREARVLRVAAGVGLSPEQAAMIVEPGSGPCGTAFAEGRTVIEQDLQAGGAESPLAAIALRCGFRAAHITPLLTFNGAAVGIIATFFRQPHRPTERDVRLVELYARQAAQSVENARLYGEAEDARRVLETLMEHVPEGIAIVDAAGRVRMASRDALRIAGWTGQPLAGADFRTLLAPYRLQGAAADCPGAICDGFAMTNEELMVEAPGGSKKYLLCNAAPVRDSDSRVAGCVVAFRDITERKTLERRLQETQKLESIGLLAGGIAHDFNNLLTSILGGASLAIDMLTDAHPAASVLRDIMSSSERAAHLTSQLLAYSGKGRFVVRNIDLSAAVRQILTLLRNSVPASTELRCALDFAPPPIKADVAQIQQLVLSLVMNAAEAIGDAPGAIMISTGVKDIAAERGCDTVGELAPGTYVFLEVRDNGCGIDERVRARIFEPFFTTKFVGRGLGLSAALGIVRGHQGGMEIETAPGKGSAFRALFPALSETAEPKSRTILVVDDEDLVNRVVELTLDRGGFRPLMARDGPEAVRAFEADPFGIAAVVLDLKLPGMTGSEVLQVLRRLRSDVKVLISTAYDEASALELVRGCSISGFIQKPYTASALLEKLRRVLEG